MRFGVRSLLFIALMALAACGPQLGSLQRGETGRVVRVFNGDTLQLESGMRVFLAEVDAPRRDEPYASQAYGELEALALHRNVLLAYGGTRRWVRHARSGPAQPHATQPGLEAPQSGPNATQPGQADTAAVAQ